MLPTMQSVLIHALLATWALPVSAFAPPASITSVSTHVALASFTLTVHEGAATSIDSGARIWDAGLALSQTLAARIYKGGDRVLELGSGTGVGGLAAAAAGAQVVLTDGVKELLPLLRDNAAANGVDASVQRLRWGEDADIVAVAAHGPFDLICGSDLLYAPEAFPELVETLVRLCHAQTEVLLTFPTRFSEPIFFEMVKEHFDELAWPVETEPGIFVSRLQLRAA